MSIQLSIITINYNGLADTCALLDTIPFDDETLEVIVVDNASKEDEGAIIGHRYPQIKVISSDKNLGFAGGNNLGLQIAQGKYILFLNNDTLLETSDTLLETSGTRHHPFFQPLIDRLERSSKIGVACPKIRFSWDNKPIQFAGYTPLSPITMRNRSIGCGEADNGQYNTAHPTPYAHGAAMMVKREVIEKAGMMPECYFLYYEELDWSMMILRAGYDIWYEPAATIYHKESQTTGQNSPLRTYYITRNRLLFVKRNNSSPKRYLSYLYLICIVSLRDILKYTLRCRFQSVKATLLGNLDFMRSKFTTTNHHF